MAGEEGLEPSLMGLEPTCYGFEDRYAPYYNIPPQLITTHSTTGHTLSYTYFPATNQWFV